VPRPERPAPGGPFTERDEDLHRDALAAARLLALLREDEAEPPDDLAGSVARRVRSRVTLHDLVEITTRAPLRTMLPLLERLLAPFSRRP
jgi:hypothetical protein